MEALNPLQIPEILLSIASYLERRHVIVCLKVCRSWDELLKPIIWKSVSVGYGSCKIPPQGSAYNYLITHSHHVTDLEIETLSDLEQYTIFPKLHTLTFHFNKYEYLNLYQSIVARFITLNTSLVYLSISVINRSDTGIQLWNAVSNLPRLKRLELSEVRLGRDEMDTFWEVFSKLEDVTLALVHFPDDGIQLGERTFSRIRKLSIYITHADELEIIFRCTNLRELEWNIRYIDNIHVPFADAIEQSSMPKLEKLEIHCRSTQEMADKHLEHIISGMQQIKTLSLHYTRFGLFSFQALRHHFSTLTDLDLYSNECVTSAMSQELLCSCSLLEKFQGRYISAKDATEGREWACLSLKVLKVKFRFGKSEQRLQHLVFRRLSSLVLIEDFGHYYYYYDDRNIHQLDMRLASGLGQLSVWKNIKYLDVAAPSQSMEEVDIRWMISNWTRLVSISGLLNKDRSIRKNLESLLVKHGIKC